MDFLNPSVFLFSAALVGLSILLMLVVSRPGLATDQPALAWWVMGDLSTSLHRVVLLLQPGVVPPKDSPYFDWPTSAFVTADAGLLIFGMAVWVKSLSLLCERPLGRASTTALLLSPIGAVLAMHWLHDTIPGEMIVFVAGGGLSLMQIVVTWRKRSASRGLTILTVANGMIALLMAAGLFAALAHFAAPASPRTGATDGPFFPPLAGILGDFVASIVRTFAVSLVLQERQRAHIMLLSTTDPLTGALNRRGAMPLMRQALDGALRHRQPLSIAILDIDHFKRVNDRFGHDAGDAVLAAFSRNLKADTRDCDVLARWGGEEFVLLMPNTAQREAMTLLERLREDMPTRLAGQVPCPVSFSAGVASLEARAATSAPMSAPMSASLAELLATADKCLYKAKVTRNCVVAAFASPSMAPAPHHETAPTP